MVEEAELDMVQLHGDEGLEACGECGVPALRVVHVPAPGSDGSGEEGSAEQRARSVVDALRPGFAAGVLLDTTVKGSRGNFWLARSGGRGSEVEMNADGDHPRSNRILSATLGLFHGGAFGSRGHGSGCS